MSDLETRAMKFAIDAHGDQMYGDHPYSYHLSQVVDNVLIRKFYDPLLSTYVAVAWLHDTMEDCGVTFKQIQDEFGLCIADAVNRLTKTKEMDYDHYIAACCISTIACEVKICDTMANLQESFRSNRSRGMAKYPKQLAMLVDGMWKGQLLFYKEIRE